MGIGCIGGIQLNVNIGDRLYHARGFKNGTLVAIRSANNRKYLHILFDDGVERIFPLTPLAMLFFPWTVKEIL